MDNNSWIELRANMELDKEILEEKLFDLRKQVSKDLIICHQIAHALNIPGVVPLDYRHVRNPPQNMDDPDVKTYIKLMAYQDEVNLLYEKLVECKTFLQNHLRSLPAAKMIQVTMKRFFIFVLLYLYFSENSNEYFVEASLEWMKPNGTTEINAIDSGRGNITYNGTDPTEDMTDWGWIVHLNEDPGYGIEIIVDELSVDASTDEYLILSAGISADETSTMIQILTSNPKYPMYFRLPRTKSFFVKFSSAQGSFNLIYYRNGAPITTSRPPTIDPSPPEEDSTIYEIHLKGKPPQAYVDDDEFVSKFKDILKALAKDYCADKNITFTEKPTDETVFLGPISRCPYEWPHDEICASVVHSIYVSGTEIKNTRLVTNYQLNSTHLKDMWEIYGKNLSLINISVYELPDASSTILWWLLVVGICLIVVLVSLMVFWKFEHFFVKEKKRESAEETIDEGIKLRNKNRARLSEYQNIPTFMTEPEAVLEYSKGSRRDKKPPKLPSLSNIESFDTSTSTQQLSPMSPVTPAGGFTAGLRFNYNNNAFEE